MKFRLLSVILATGLAAAATSHAQLIAPVGVTGGGTYSNNASLVIDGVTPAEASAWNAATNVYWTDPNVSFTIDLGALYSVSDLRFSVDNNDKYIFEYSANGVAYTGLFNVQPNYGEIPSSPGGMDTMSTDASSGEYVSQIDFAPVDARFLRVKGAGQDFFYAVGEVQAFGTLTSAVPEPSTYGLLGAAGLLGLVAWRRRKAKA